VTALPCARVGIYFSFNPDSPTTLFGISSHDLTQSPSFSARLAPVGYVSILRGVNG
jgi:hypothetical protein